MLATFRSLKRCKSGASAMEYALLIGVFCTLLVAGATALGVAINAPFGNFAGQLTTP